MMKNKILIAIAAFIFIIIILFNIDIFSETKYFNIGSGEIKKEKCFFYIKVHEVQEETDFSNILKENGLYNNDSNWIFAGSVKYIGFSKMYVCGIGGTLYEASKEFCLILNSNINDNIMAETKTEYVKKFQDLLKAKNRQEITTFLQKIQRGKL